MLRKDLEGLSRDDLVAKAEELGVVRPRTLTMPELIDEILLATERRTGQTQKRSRGWFGRARDLLTSVIDRGLAEPTSTRGDARLARTAPTAPAPLPTVTLAEIYAAQGHFERAITTLDEVIARDPDHAEAQKLRERFAEQLRRTRPSAPPPAVELRPVTLPPPPAVSEALETAALAGRSLTTDHAAAGPEASTATAASDVAPPSPAAPVDPTIAAAAPELLDERYDVDEIVAIAVDPHTVYAYWEVRPTTLAEVRARAPEGALTLRVVAVAPHDDGVPPRTEARDVRVDALSGDLFLRDVPANANVRVTIGWKGSDFFPVAVGLDLSTPRETPTARVSRDVARFDAAGVADAFDALRAGGLARGGATAAPRGQAVGRTTPEEIALGHGAEESFEPRLVVTTDEQRTPDGRLLHIESRPLRGGASELLRIEKRFFGASEQSRREVRFFGASDQLRPPRPAEDRAVRFA